MKPSHLGLAFLLFAGLPVLLSQQSTSHVARSGVISEPRPILFEANRGQVRAEVRFLARGSSYALFLASDEMVMAMGQRGSGAVLRMRLVDANPGVEVIGLDRVAGHSNYF